MDHKLPTIIFKVEETQQRIEPEQQEWSSTLNQVDPKPPKIKEEPEEHFSSEELQTLAVEDVIMFPLTSLPLKTESKDKLESLHCHQSWAEKREAEPLTSSSVKHMKMEADRDPMKTEAGREDCSGLNPAGSLDPDGCLQLHTDVKSNICDPHATEGGSDCVNSDLRNKIRKCQPVAVGEEETDLVADLLGKPFSGRTFQEKLEIVRKGRPMPQLATLKQQGKGFVRHFQTSNYERYKWLTVSTERCRLYCWGCLLFSTDWNGVWSHAGFANLNCLTKAALRHQSTAGHLYATVLLKTFGDTRVDLSVDEQVQSNVELHNEKVKKNREILKKLIDCVIFGSKQEFLIRGCDESEESINLGIYVQLLSFLAEHDKDLHYHLSTNNVFTGTSGTMVNDLISAAAEVMEEEIKQEVSRAPYVAVMVDETSDLSTGALLALVLRYVTDTGVKERFIRLDSVADDKSADDAAALIIKFLEEYKCLEKVVAQCFTGTAVTASGVNEVQAKVKTRAPMALFVHCYAHQLTLILTQGASKLRECKIFFAHLTSLAAFLSRFPKQSQLFGNICLQVVPTRWQCSSRLVSMVYEKRVSLKKLFEDILEHYDEYDQESVRSADEYMVRLDDFEFCFLLSTFQGIFKCSDMLFGILQNKSLDVQFCLKRVEEFCNTIEVERGRFGEIYEWTVRQIGPPSTQRDQVQGDSCTRYQKLHSDILDNILAQIQNRFKDHKNFMFFSLLDPQQFQTYRKKFPDAAFSSLSHSYGALFDLPRLKTELTVMYAMADFEGKSPAELLMFLQQKVLCESLPYLYALACLTVTIPVSAPSLNLGFSALKRYKMYSSSAIKQDRLLALTSMAIEKELLLELKNTDVLYDRVIEHFIKKERRMDFVFK
ncbi:zinc finger MYM-type protein 1-like [Thalassophryne amazonica]|uniref:zinc finger MYM-type protein 1-like n=1 Tax=Thalassophryne amazonica TaxID=390379 RepID=UPI00147154D4|nr:zinc finger MYM-type protein 1-like [Thalassophryne amazonica]